MDYRWFDYLLEDIPGLVYCGSDCKVFFDSLRGGNCTWELVFVSFPSSWQCLTMLAFPGAGYGQALGYPCQTASWNKIFENQCWKEPIPYREAENFHAANTCTCLKRQSGRLCGTVSFGVTCTQCDIRGNGVVMLHDSLILDQVCSLFPLDGVLVCYNVSLEVLLRTWGTEYRFVVKVLEGFGSNMQVSNLQNWNTNVGLFFSALYTMNRGIIYKPCYMDLYWRQVESVT